MNPTLDNMSKWCINIILIIIYISKKKINYKIEFEIIPLKLLLKLFSYIFDQYSIRIHINIELESQLIIIYFKVMLIINR